MTGLVHGAGVPPSIAHANVAGVIVEWKLNVALPEFVGPAGPLSMIVSAIALAKEYVCTSKVRPSSSVGATVTVVPATVTLMKWKTCVADVAGVAAPQLVPFSFVGDQPRPNASNAWHGPIGSSVPPPPPEM